MKYFGRPYNAAIYEGIQSTLVPIDQSCVYCSERFLEGDDGFIDAGNSPLHRECFLRMIVGSVAHQMHACNCALGEDAVDSEEGVSRREGAKLAVAYLESRRSSYPAVE
jgi:hypothetical protein